MRLPAVMGLVIEEMGDEKPLWSADLSLSGSAKPHQILREPCLIDLCGPARDIGIGLVASRAELGEILDEMIAFLDRRRGLRPIIEAAHPLTVAPQDVHESAVERAPECPLWQPSFGIAEPPGRCVQSPVHFGIVGCHRPDKGHSDHRRSPICCMPICDAAKYAFPHERPSEWAVGEMARPEPCLRSRALWRLSSGSAVQGLTASRAALAN